MVTDSVGLRLADGGKSRRDVVGPDNFSAGGRR